MPPILMEKYLAAAEKIDRRRLEVRRGPQAHPHRPARAIRRKTATPPAKSSRPSPNAPGAGRSTDDEIKRLLRFVDAADKNGDPFETGIQLALQAVLASPHFLFRVEIDKDAGRRRPHAVSDWELATRLSYFLWSSMPDEELFDHARQGDLHQPDVLEAQVRRMLKDPKAHALVENFADQWLLIRNLKSVTPDPKLFPTFDESLRSAMLKETELYLRERRCARTAASSTSSTPIIPSSTNGWRSITASTASRATTSAR